ncbi:MAG: hypothetical protein HC882_03990 [Acidobacteria bacterium]|nr:hypothetical protein [Acidobacteriota bacterium]
MDRGHVRTLDAERAVESMLEAHQIVTSTYDALLEGTWRPVLTQTAPGNLRIDLYDFERKEDSDGNPMLEAKALFWGLDDNVRVSWGQLSLRYWYTAPPDPVMKRQLKKEGRPTDRVEQVLGKAEGDSTPYIFLQSPEGYVATFPSYVAIGRMRFPAVPRQAESMDLAMTFTARKGGDQYEAELSWEKLDIPDAWRLGEGEVWAADEIEATHEEILGRDGSEEASAAAN